MKVYRKLDTFFVPGQQPKGAEKLDLATTSPALVAFLNDLVADISSQAAVGQLMAAHVAQENHEAALAETLTQRMLEPRQVIDEPRQASARIEDEAFEALPLAHQLHLAALALENARSELR